MVLFLVSVLDDRSGSGSDAEMAAISAFNGRLRANGHWVLAGGLMAPEHAEVIDNRAGHGLVVPGPWVQSAEHVSGFWVIEAPDQASAHALALEASLHCNRRVELRPFIT